MAKYVIELDQKQLEDLNYFINLKTGDNVDYSKLYALQKSLLNIKPLSHLDLQQELYDIQNASIQSFQVLSLEDKVKTWLLKNKAHAHRDPLGDGYRIVINDNDNGTKIMFISDEHIINDPMDVVQKVTNLLKGSAFFQNWDDDDENDKAKKTLTLLPWQPNSPDGKLKYPWNDYIDSSGYTAWEPSTVCNHEWKTYTGLFEQFEYCSKCDEKKGKH